MKEQLRQLIIMEHKAELRFLLRDEQRVKARISELKKILSEIYGETV